MGSLVASPSIGGKLLASAQDVRLSDDATWMSHRNDSNFPKRAGETKLQGRLSFAYFSFGEAKKSKARGRRIKNKKGREQPRPDLVFTTSHNPQNIHAYHQLHVSPNHEHQFQSLGIFR